MRPPAEPMPEPKALAFPLEKDEPMLVECLIPAISLLKPLPKPKARFGARPTRSSAGPVTNGKIN